MDNRHIVIFDGVCNFCNWAVNFIIKRDPDGVFAFTPIQSELAHELMKKHRVTSFGIETVLLIKNDQCFAFSDAALEITKDLAGLWFLFTIFRFVPRPFRDAIYKLLARNRYKLFGKKATCMVPSKEHRSRFVGI